MSSSENDVAAPPLVIIRRRKNSEESHHGGVWKIAYADFMTAMMAFFLVMWLVNAADKQTIVQVAAYFNPMRLTDRHAAIEGLDEQTENDPPPVKKKTWAEKLKQDEKSQDDDGGGKGTQNDKLEAAEKNKADNSKDHAKKAVSGSAEQDEMEGAEAQKKEAAMLSQPDQVLNTIAAKGKVRLQRSRSGANAEFSDPFDISNPAPQQTVSLAKDMKDRKRAKAKAGVNDANVNVESQPAASTAVAADEEQVKQLAEEIRAVARAISGMTPTVVVKATSEGLLLSLVDNNNEGMFEVGSARPKPDTVLLLEKIGQILRQDSRNLIVRGHTDGRPYKTLGYDNWRLSSARAQMAFYMLKRGGLEDERFLGIEGRGDRDLRRPDNKMADENRRIDILLKSEKK